MKSREIYNLLVSIHETNQSIFNILTNVSDTLFEAKKYINNNYKSKSIEDSFSNLTDTLKKYIDLQKKILNDLEKLIKKYRPIHQIDSFVDLDGDSRKDYTYLFDGEWELYPLLRELRKIYKDIYIYSNVYYWWNRKTREISIDYIVAGRALEYTIYSLTEWTVRPIDNLSNLFEDENNNDQSDSRLPF